MSPSSSLDRESFQQLLANAFAVQESQMDGQSLSVIVEVQRLIAKGELDVDGAIRLIVECARNVANASGVAIGLLNRDQLVYRAGSGTAATYVGRRRMVTLTVPADTQASREILRVENTQTDTRIEGAICRQYGAKSLLMLLIYHDRSVAGVLEILFSEAHAFQDREVRTYRLMAGLIGDAMSHAAQLEQKKNLAAKLPTTPHAIEQITPQREKFLNDGGSLPDPANKHPIYQRCVAAMAMLRELPVLRQPALLATLIMERGKDVTWPKRRWSVALAAVAIALVLTCWITFSDRRPASPLGSSALPRSIAIEQQVPVVPAKAIPAKVTTQVLTAPVPAKESRVARATFKRVRVGEDEVAYIGEDVTVRYFKLKLAPHRVRVGEDEVAYIGEDVTVRYFTPKPAVMPPRPVRSAAQPVAPSWPVPANSVSSKPAK
jgi:GAF domain-containing protein